MRVLAMLVLLLSTAQAGSAAGVTITIHSQPEGASVYGASGALLGVTPLDLKYPTPRRWKGCLSLQPLTVTWMSGAKASFDTLTACAQNTKRQQVSFIRPEAWPNLQIDLEWAFKMAQLSIDQARLAALQAASVPAYTWVPSPTITRPLHCTSLLIGSQIVTSCL